MKRCAFLTMANMDTFECYDHLLYKPFANVGWDVTTVPWRDTAVNWNDFGAVIIRSPWDYQQEPALFIAVLKTIEESTAHLENTLDIVRWNIDKTYLKDLQTKGIQIVPTIWQDSLISRTTPSFFKDLNATEIIIKPVISANADHTFRLQNPIEGSTNKQLENIFSDRPFMVQPFMKNVITEGEFSLFYFAGAYSHTILKTPKSGDFRVQEEHGGQLTLVEPEPKLLSAGKKTMQALPEIPLYSRVDFVRTVQNHFALMEVELIEPSLYFNMDPESAMRFSNHFDEWMHDKI
jgi:hypothetical protein